MLYQRGCGKQLHDYAKEQLLLVAMTALIASILQVGYVLNFYMWSYFNPFLIVFMLT